MKYTYSQNGLGKRPQLSAIMKRNVLFYLSSLILLLSLSCSSTSNVRYIPLSANELLPNQKVKLMWAKDDVNWYSGNYTCLYKIDGNKLNCDYCANNAIVSGGEHKITYLIGPVEGSAFGGSPYSSGVATGKHPNLTYWKVKTITQNFEVEKAYKWERSGFVEVPVSVE